MLGLTPLLARLEASALADWVGGPIYPLISALHILSISFLIAPVVLADLRVLMLKGIDDGAVRLSRIAFLGFGAAATTGVLLFSVQATRYAENPAVLIKFALILLAGANAALFVLFNSIRPFNASLSIVIWCSVVVAGRWIAFAE